MFIFPVQLTTSRIGNLTRLIHTLLYVLTIHTYIPDVDGGVLPVDTTTQTVFNGDGIIIGGVREPLSRDKNYKARTVRFGPFWVEGQGFGKVDAGSQASCINLRPPS